LEKKLGILEFLEVPLTIKELVKGNIKFNDLDKESDEEQNIETLTKYEENESDLDIDEDLVYDEN